jgi:acyl-homoserine lactone acylase PvdQ
MRLAENVPTSPQSFIAAMQPYTGSENWFYVDDRNIAVYQSGWFPQHAAGSDPDLPIWGTGQWDWKGFKPSTDGYDRLPASANPRSIDPPQGYLVNWNNAIAHGWRVAAGDWEDGPVVRATILQDDLHAALGSGPPRQVDQHDHRPVADLRSTGDGAVAVAARRARRRRIEL